MNFHNESLSIEVGLRLLRLQMQVNQRRTRLTVKNEYHGIHTLECKYLLALHRRAYNFTIANKPHKQSSI